MTELQTRDTDIGKWMINQSKSILVHDLNYYVSLTLNVKQSSLKDHKEILHNKYISIMCLSIRIKGLPDKLSPILIFRYSLMIIDYILKQNHTYIESKKC